MLDKLDGFFVIRNFDFEIKHIKGKENKVTYALNRIFQMAHLATMRTYEMNVKERINEALLHD